MLDYRHSAFSWLIKFVWRSNLAEILERLLQDLTLPLIHLLHSPLSPPPLQINTHFFKNIEPRSRESILNIEENRPEQQLIIVIYLKQPEVDAVIKSIDNRFE